MAPKRRLRRLAAHIAPVPASSSDSGFGGSSGRGAHADEWRGTAPSSRSWDGATPAAGSEGARALTLGAAQILTDHDPVANSVKICEKIREAAAAGVSILLFHEGCLTGYPMAEDVEVMDWDAVVAEEARIAALAGELGIAVLLGTTSRRAPGEFHNDVLVINERGEALGRYSKTWRAGEPHYSAGSGPVVFEVQGVKATVLICHDLRYPEFIRLAVAAGARIVFMPNNEGGLPAEDKLEGYRAMQVSRATENMVSTSANICVRPQSDN